MRNFRFILLIIIVLATAAWAVGQPQSTATDVHTLEHAKWGSQIRKFSYVGMTRGSAEEIPGKCIITGTCIELQFKTFVGLFSDEQHYENPFVGGNLISRTVTIDGRQIPNLSVPGSDRAFNNTADEVRFASNEFADAKEVVVKIEATFRLKRADGTIDPTIRESTATAKLLVYNRAIIVSTKEAWNSSLGYHVPPNEAPDSVPGIAKATGDVALAWLPNVNHKITPGVADHHTITKQAFSSAVKRGTVVFAVTHGERIVDQRYMAPSVAGNNVPDWMAYLGSTGTIYEWVRKDRIIPFLPPDSGYNMAMVFTCNTGYDAVQNGFGTGKNDGKFIDRAMVMATASTLTVNIRVVNSSEWVPISTPIAAFLGYLAEGDTVDKAVKRTKDQWHLPFFQYGDDAMTIKNVYTGVKNSTSTSWYLLLASNVE